MNLIDCTASIWIALMPPQEYVGRPQPLPVIEIETATPDLICRTQSTSSSGTIHGCAQLTEAACIVYRQADVPGVDKCLVQIVREHELAHCAGWVHGTQPFKLVR